MSTEKTHYRKAFDSPYLSSADIVEPTILTIKYVSLESDKTKKTKEAFNTAHFVESELRRGEKLKPMILNASNSKTLKGLTGTPFIDDWQNLRITVYVDHNVRFGKETVEGLRISPYAPEQTENKPLPAISDERLKKAIAAIKDGTFSTVKLHAAFALTQAQNDTLVTELSKENA